MAKKEFETTEEVAARLGLTPPTVREWIKKGILKGNIYGRDYLIPFGEMPDKSKLPTMGRPPGSKSYPTSAFEPADQEEVSRIADECI